MGSIRQTSDSGSGGTKGVEFIWCVDGQDPQIHGIWCLCSDGVTREVHWTAQIEVGAGTVGKCTNNYLSENWHRIPIIGQISINGNVKLLGIPDFVRNGGLYFIENLQAPTVPSVWGGDDASNHKWGVIPGGGYSNFAVAWGSTVSTCPAYTPRSP